MKVLKLKGQIFKRVNFKKIEIKRPKNIIFIEFEFLKDYYFNIIPKKFHYLKDPILVFNLQKGKSRWTKVNRGYESLKEFLMY